MKIDYADILIDSENGIVTIKKCDEDRGSCYCKDVELDSSGEYVKLKYTRVTHTYIGYRGITLKPQSTFDVTLTDEGFLNTIVSNGYVLDIDWFDEDDYITLKRDSYTNFDKIEIEKICKPIKQKFIEKILGKKQEFDTYYTVRNEIKLESKETVKEEPREHSFSKNIKFIINET